MEMRSCDRLLVESLVESTKKGRGYIPCTSQPILVDFTDQHVPR